MTDKPKKLFDTARALLIMAATRNDHLIALPKLPVAATRQVVRSLLNSGLAEEVPTPIEDTGYAWRTGEDGGVPMLRATMVGLAHIAVNERTPPDSALIGTVAETAVEVPATTGTDAEGARSRGDCAGAPDAMPTVPGGPHVRTSSALPRGGTLGAPLLVERTAVRLSCLATDQIRQRSGECQVTASSHRSRP
jgi:hypothetical protein